ncbi:ankyrin repeat domain-containing protein [Paracoccaceae bacterium GXU_MW_L88]
MTGLRLIIALPTGRTLIIETWFQALRANDDFDLTEITDYGAVSEDGYSLLQTAIASRPRYAVNLVALGARIDHQDHKGQTALQYAISRGYADIARALIRAGADVKLVDAYGNGPLWTAVMQPKPDLEIIKLIFDRGGDPHQVNAAGRSPLSMAITKNDEDILAIIG